MSEQVGAVLLTDATGAVIWRAEYDPYGNIFAYRTGATLHQPLRLPGQVAQDGSELYYNVHRWYRAGWGRYTQADPLGVVSSDVNDYVYVADNPIVYKDPSGLVKIKQAFQRLGGMLGGGGQYSLAFGRAFTNGKCVGCGNNWKIELSLFYIHGYYCTGSTDCSIERTHANIASAFVAGAAEEYRKYELPVYADKAICNAMALSYANDLKTHILNPNGWDSQLKKNYIEAQQNYEATHHGICGWVPGLCAYWGI
jgi:RHS repeat-associated protein